MKMKNKVQLILPYKSEIISGLPQKEEINYLRVKKNSDQKSFELILLNNDKIKFRKSNSEISLKVIKDEEDLLFEILVGKNKLIVESIGTNLSNKYREYAKTLEI